MGMLSDFWRWLFADPTRPAQPASTETARVLIVGINKYQIPGADLQYCVPDALAMAKIFRAWLGDDRVVMLLDEQATRKRYEAELRKCLDVRPGGWSVLYHSGHGSTQVEGPTGWDEYKPGQPGHGFDEGIVLHDSGAGHLFVDDDYAAIIRAPVAAGVRHVAIWDTCFSGGMYRAFGLGGRPRCLPGPLAIRPRRFGYRASGENDKHLVLAACGEAEYSLEAVQSDGTGHGAFTWHLLKQLSTTATWGGMFHEVKMRMIQSLAPQHPMLIGSETLQHMTPFQA